MKKLTDSCNCTWVQCPNHPNGDICPNDAVGFLCDNCDEEHWVGDGTIGKGVRLCPQCGGEIANFFIEDIPRFMGEIEPLFPTHVKAINEVLRNYYIGQIKNGNWETAFRDALALMEFVSLVHDCLPIDKFEECVRISEKLQGMIKSFAIQVDLDRVFAEKGK